MKSSVENQRDFMLEQGPHYEVQVNFDHKTYPKFNHGRAKVKISALIDTGSQLNCIDKQLARILDLPIVSTKPITVTGVGGSFNTTMHLAQVYIPRLDHVVIGRFLATNLNSVGQNHGIILGRQFLQDFKLIYNGEIGDFILVRADFIKSQTDQYKRFNTEIISLAQTYPFLDLTKYIIPLDDEDDSDDKGGDNFSANGNPELNLAVVTNVA